MGVRVAVFGLLQLLAAGLGWLALGWPGMALALALVGLGGAVVNGARAQRFLRWVRDGGGSPVPMQRGLWGEVAYRTVRALRGEQQKAADANQRLQDFLAAIQASPNGVVLLDPEGRIEWFNDIAARHFGFVPQRDLLQHIGNLVREPGFLAYCHGQNYTRDVRSLGRADPHAPPVKLSVQLYPYGQGHKLMLSTDITALAQAEAMRRDFVANVSHEIRTPLTVLAGFVETMQTLPLGEAERDRYLDLMAGQAQRMQALVNDLLLLSRLEGSPLPDAQEVIDLGALMDQCAAEARGLSALLHPKPADAHHLVFGEAPDFALAGSLSELRSAASNLVNNAVRYTPAGGRIEVRWERLPHGGVRLAVTDTGPGIAPQHLPRIGERFYRVDRSRSRESGGTGLGLAITKHVAQRHGGELQVTSQLGQGSCFSLVFPAQRLRPAPEAKVKPVPAAG